MSTNKIVEELEFELNEIDNLLDSHLKWSEMEHLVTNSQQTWEKFKTNILSFITTIRDNSNEVTP